MKNKYTITYLVLLVLTSTTAVFSNIFSGLKAISILILILSALKFLLVAFNFMELKKAHLFWKVLLLIYLSVFVGVISVIF